MASRDPEQWMKWLEEVENEEQEIYAESDEDSEKDEIEMSEHDTDTEQEAEETDEDEAVSTGQVQVDMTDVPYYLGKDKTTRWNKVPPPRSRTKSHNLIVKVPSLIGAARSAKTPLDCFFVFVDDKIIDVIVECTNIFIGQIKEKFQRERDANLTDHCEIRAFIGILYLAGVTHSGKKIFLIYGHLMVLELSTYT